MATVSLSEDEKNNFHSKIGSKMRQFSKKLPTGPIPVSYVCNKCHVKGHWIHECPGIVDINGRHIDFKSVKRPTGIPSVYLTEVDANTPNSYLTSDGRYVITKGTLMALQRSGALTANNKETEPIRKRNFSFSKDVSVKDSWEEDPHQEIDYKCGKLGAEWSLDKSLEEEINGIIKAQDEADLTDDIFSLSGVTNKIMLTADDYANKVDPIANNRPGITNQEYQKISVVNFSINDASDDATSFEVADGGYVHQWDFGPAVDYVENTNVLGAKDSAMVGGICVNASREDQVDLLQRQLEEEFLSKLVNKPVMKSKIKGSNHDDERKSRKHSGHSKHRSSKKEGSIGDKSRYSGSKHCQDSHRREERTLRKENHKKTHGEDRRSRSRSNHRNRNSSTKNVRNRDRSASRPKKYSDRSDRTKSKLDQRKDGHSRDRDPRKDRNTKDVVMIDLWPKNVLKVERTSPMKPRVNQRQKEDPVHGKVIHKPRSRSRSDYMGGKYESISISEDLWPKNVCSSKVESNSTAVREKKVPGHGLKSYYDYDYENVKSNLNVNKYNRERNIRTGMARKLWTEEYFHEKVLCSSRSRSK